jgi:hypothetical protein
MGLATKAEILSAQDWDYDEFDVEKWGRVRIRALSAAERLAIVRQFGDDTISNEHAFVFFARLIASSMVDENGELLFDPDKDIEALQGRSWSKLQFMAERIMAFNGMTPEANKELSKN